MGKKNDAWMLERHEISDQVVAAAVGYQGRQNYMEDNFKIIKNINGSDISIFAICDGHAGSFASEYATNIIIPAIADKIQEILIFLQPRILKAAEARRNKKNGKEEVEVPSQQENGEESPLEKYVTKYNKINYEVLLHDEILEADRVLLERMAKACLFCGTTLCLVVVDISNKLIVCGKF